MVGGVGGAYKSADHRLRWNERVRSLSLVLAWPKSARIGFYEPRNSWRRPRERSKKGGQTARSIQQKLDQEAFRRPQKRPNGVEHSSKIDKRQKRRTITRFQEHEPHDSRQPPRERSKKGPNRSEHSAKTRPGGLPSLATRGGGIWEPLWSHFGALLGA